MQEPSDDRPALSNISAVVNVMSNILSTWQVYQFVGRVTGSMVSDLVWFTPSWFPDHLKATALTLGFDSFLRKPFRDRFGFSPCDVLNSCKYIEFGCDNISQLVTELLCSHGRRRESIDLRRLSSRTALSTLLQSWYGKRTVWPRGRCVIILVMIRRWSETHPHSFDSAEYNIWIICGYYVKDILSRVCSWTCKVRFNIDSMVLSSSLILSTRLPG